MNRMKKTILLLLYKHRGTYLSGQQISEKLQISRTAVWKHIRNLIQEGHCIEAEHRKGYRLAQDTELFLPEIIHGKRQTKWLGTQLIVLDSVSSTNRWARDHLNELDHGALILAEEQTEGRGRMGRAWNSEKGSGLWMTLVLRPALPLEDAAKMTQMAAAAMHQTIYSVVGLESQIKWPNDLLMGDRKICGILTEISGELNQMESLIVGIGLNVLQESFPGEIKETAGSLLGITGKKVARTALLTDFLKRFEDMYQMFIEQGNYGPVLSVVRKYSMLLNRRIDIIRGNTRTPATAVAIHEDGRLEVVYDDQVHELLSGGEVSVRPESSQDEEKNTGNE